MTLLHSYLRSLRMYCYMFLQGTVSFPLPTESNPQWALCGKDLSHPVFRTCIDIDLSVERTYIFQFYVCHTFRCPPTMNKLLQFQIIAGSIMSPSSTRTGGEEGGSATPEGAWELLLNKANAEKRKTFLLQKVPNSEPKPKTEPRVLLAPNSQSAAPKARTNTTSGPTRWVWLRLRLRLWPVAKSTAAAQDDAAIAWGITARDLYGIPKKYGRNVSAIFIGHFKKRIRCSTRARSSQPSLSSRTRPLSPPPLLLLLLMLRCLLLLLLLLLLGDAVAPGNKK